MDGDTDEVRGDVRRWPPLLPALLFTLPAVCCLSAGTDLGPSVTVAGIGFALAALSSMVGRWPWTRRLLLIAGGLIVLLGIALIVAGVGVNDAHYL
jgi:cell division protein FtsW (lipid II flippase)